MAYISMGKKTVHHSVSFELEMKAKVQWNQKKKNTASLSEESESIIFA